MVHVPAGAEHVPWIEGAVLVQIQMVLRDELPKVLRTQVILLRSEGVLQVKGVHAELVGVHDHRVVRHPAGHPVVTSDGFHPPDLFFVIEGDAVGLIGAELLQKLSQAQHALPGRADIGQHQYNDILFSDAAGDLLLSALFRLFQLHQGVRRQHPGVGGDGLGGRHTHIRRVDARSGPDAVLGVHAGAGGIAQGLIRQLDLHMGEYALVFPHLLFRLHHHKFLYVKMPVVGAGDHGRTVVAGLASDQNRCAGHLFSSFILQFILPSQ